MIRINLLPVRAAKKKETAIQQLFILGAGVVVVLVIVVTAWAIRLGQISSLNNDIRAAEAKISELKTKIGKLDEVKKLKEEVKKKLDVLTLLRKNKTGPASRMATISTALPSGKIWLEKYKENAMQVNISGLAFEEELIAQFIKNMEDSKEFEKVDLIVSEQKMTGTTKLKRFDLTLKIEGQVAANKEPQKK